MSSGRRGWGEGYSVNLSVGCAAETLKPVRYTRQCMISRLVVAPQPHTLSQISYFLCSFNSVYVKFSLLSFEFVL